MEDAIKNISEENIEENAIPETIGMSQERLAHCLGVARKAYEIATDKGLSPDKRMRCFVLGYVHDIGYEFSITPQEHAGFGGMILRRADFPLWPIVYAHGDPNPDPIFECVELNILNAADMSVDSKGRNVTFGERLKDIEDRYGKDSEEFENASAVVENLREKGYEF